MLYAGLSEDEMFVSMARNAVQARHNLESLGQKDTEKARLTI